MIWQSLMSEHDRLPIISLEEWYSALQARLPNAAPMQLALHGGRFSATPGLAFLAGYQAALRALWPAAPKTLGALCVSEQRSTRPADMQTRLNGLQLTGRKDFVTAAEAADWLLVSAREDAEGEPVRLVLAVVHNGAQGVQVEPLPALPLMPDIGHARLHLQAAHCERLPGDGWSDYVKPFRTLEDVHVLAALTAWLFGVGQEQAWPQSVQLRLIGLAAGCAEVGRLCPGDAHSHVLLAGLFAQFEALRGDLDAAFATASDEHWQALWQRDKGVLAVAMSARQKRLEKALQHLAMRL
jgi:hypothetical protein